MILSQTATSFEMIMVGRLLYGLNAGNLISFLYRFSVDTTDGQFPLILVDLKDFRDVSLLFHHNYY